jgi:phage/plasmid-associated DNA primase
MSEMLNAAHDYASEGQPILPCWWTELKDDEWVCACAKGSECRSPGKHPISALTPHGAKDATTDIETIDRWFDAYPLLNIAWLMGPRAGAAAVDAESLEGHGVDGRGNFQALIAAQEEPSNTSVFTTTSGGKNSVYGCTAEIIAPDTYNLVEGVQLRFSENYYIMVPPSVIHGKPYTWLNHWRSRREIPGWLVKRASSNRHGNGDERVVKGVKDIPDVATPGTRHGSLISLLGTLKNRGVNHQTMLDAALAFNANQCDPPKDETYVREQVAYCFATWETPPIKVALTRGDRLLLRVAKKAKNDEDDEGDSFRTLYSDVDDDREAIDQLIWKLAWWCNGDAARMARLLTNSPRMKDFKGDSAGVQHEIERCATEVTDGFEDADVVEYLNSKWTVSHDRVAAEVLRNHHFLTPTDTKEIYVFVESTGEDDRRIGIYDDDGLVTIEKDVEKILKHRYSTNAVREVAAVIRARSYVTREALDSTPVRFIPLRNGVFDVDSGELLDYEPGMPFFYTHPGAYHPELLDRDCLAKKAIEDVLPNDADIPDGYVQDIDVFRQIGGFAFYRGSPFKKSLMLVGGPDSGKSLILFILREAVGKDARARKTIQDLTENRFAEAALYHVTANIAADIGSLGIVAVGKFNELTGSLDTQNRERKGIDAVEFFSYATHYFSTNDLPGLSPKVRHEEAKAFYSRWILIETIRHFVDSSEPDESANERKKNGLLGEKIMVDQQSLDWATTWFIDGLRTVLKQGKFSESMASNDVKTRWVEKTGDSISHFVEKNVVFTVGQKVRAEDFKRAYLDYCTKNGLVAQSDENVGRRLPRLVPGVEKFESNGKWWRNVSAKGVTGLVEEGSQPTPTPTPELDVPDNNVKGRPFLEPAGDNQSRLEGSE